MLVCLRYLEGSHHLHIAVFHLIKLLLLSELILEWSNVCRLHLTMCVVLHESVSQSLLVKFFVYPAISGCSLFEFEHVLLLLLDHEHKGGVVHHLLILLCHAQLLEGAYHWVA